MNNNSSKSSPQSDTRLSLHRREALQAATLAAASAGLFVSSTRAEAAAATPSRNPVTDHLLTPQNCALALIDYQPDMLFAVASIDRQSMLNNVTGLAKAAVAFKLPIVLSTIGAMSSLNGNTVPSLAAVLTQARPIDRTSMNAWEDPHFVAAVNATKRKKLVISALWTEVCLAYPVLDALKAGYEVYTVTDTCGGTSKEAHDRAIDRMLQAGARPVTWLQVMLELQRDWARKETHDAVFSIGREHAGTWGVSLAYEDTMRALGARPPAEK